MQGISAEVRGAPGISLQAMPRPGAVTSALSRTMFEAGQLSGDQIECDIITSAPPLTPVEVSLVSSKKKLSQDNPFVFDLRLQLHPEVLSGVMTLALGDKGSEGKIKPPRLTGIGDYVAEYVTYQLHFLSFFHFLFFFFFLHNEP